MAANIKHVLFHRYQNGIGLNVPNEQFAALMNLCVNN